MLLQHIFSTAYLLLQAIKRIMFLLQMTISVVVPCKCGLPLAFCLEVATFICLL